MKNNYQWINREEKKKIKDKQLYKKHVKTTFENLTNNSIIYGKFWIMKYGRKIKKSYFICL